MGISWRNLKTTTPPAELEQQLIATAADAVQKAAQDSGGWWRLNQLRNRSRELISTFLTRTAQNARAVVTGAAQAGRLAAEQDLHAALLPVVAADADIEVAANARREVTDRIAATAPTAIRSGDRLYSQALAAIIAQPAASRAHRLRVAQGVLDDLSAAGITGFVDKAGRNWNLVSYVEMATRAVALNAAIDAHVGTLAANDQHLVVVSAATACCDLCAPWDGSVLAIDDSGSSGGEVAGTLAEARDAGLFHPNCRCVIDRWSEGDPIPEVIAPDPEAYAATQRLRSLERQVRASKRVRAAALDDLATHAANTRIRVLQKRIREHIGATDVRRQRHREQIGRAL
ncbi:phage minor capsid protein [Nocardia sp. NBC_01388]|uniref:phage minor capsid protein n=1 Tax=Nocardia sp. NBC_01388 TaxID=2903596 RepID=UPI00324CDC57